MESSARLYLFGSLLAALITVAGFSSGPALAQDTEADHERERAHETCDSYDMDVATDMALLKEQPAPIVMGADAEGRIPAVELGRTYEITLHPQTEVNFTVEPGRVLLDEGSYAGFMAVTVPDSGRYRFSFSAASWVDVAGDGENLDPALFAGRHACKPLRKLIDYDLDAGKPYLLMLSGASKSEMLMAARRVEE